MFKRALAVILTTAFICFSTGNHALSEEIQEFEIPAVIDTPLDPAPDDPDMVPVADTETKPSTERSEDNAAYLEEDSEILLSAQRNLITLGYLKGIADGIYGPMTEAALRSFQDASGLSSTGHLDPETLSLLDQLVIDTASTTEFQQRLIDLGYLRGTADGKWGPRSTAAMKSFQELNNLSVTGTIDDASRAVLFSDAVSALPGGLSVGSRGDEVVILQKKLIQYGFLAGNADGAYGQQTSKAVKAFQEYLNAQGRSITADGDGSPVTLYYLYLPDFSTYVSKVSLGSTGSEVKRVETRLANLGYMDATPDEEFDAYAARALELFQRQTSLPNTGIADRVTSELLFSAAAPSTDRCALHEITKGDNGLVVTYVEKALYTGGMVAILSGGRYGSDVETALERLYEYAQITAPSKAALFADATHLSTEAVTVLLDGLLEPHGAANEAEITRIQRRLHALYYLGRYEIDGKLGDSTTSAIRQFQSTNGLPETGGVDSETLLRLFSDDAIAKRLPYRVEVSINAQTVTVYEWMDTGEYVQVHQFTCSTGLGNSTPRGIFLDGYPANRWHHFKKFDCWAQYSFEIEGNIMFHSVLYSEKDTSTLREGSVYALGSPASHGCIRLSVKSAQWLFNHCKRGSLVIVIY